MFYKKIFSEGETTNVQILEKDCFIKKGSEAKDNRSALKAHDSSSNLEFNPKIPNENEILGLQDKNESYIIDLNYTVFK